MKIVGPSEVLRVPSLAAAEMRRAYAADIGAEPSRAELRRGGWKERKRKDISKKKSNNPHLKGGE